MASTVVEGGKRAPSWRELLDELSGNDDDLKRLVQRYVTSGRPLDAAQLIRREISAGQYRATLVDRFENGGLGPGRIHELINQIDPKIVFTTNFDSIYEDYCSSGRAATDMAYRVKNYYDPGLVNDLRSPNSLIVKLHGSVSMPERTLLSRTDYYNARAQYPGFFEVVKALILTNTLLFVGCSMDTDPHIQLFLEWASGAIHQDLRHYAIVPEEHDSRIYDGLSQSMNVNFIKYSKGRHEQVVEYLEALLSEVERYRSARHGG